jgi:hypothetical protein
VGMTDLLAGGPQACAPRFRAPLEHAARGGALLHAGNAVEVVDGGAPHEAEKLADTWSGVAQRQGVGLVGLGSLDEVECQVAAQVVVRRKQRQVALAVFWHGDLGQALGYPLAGGLVGDLRTDGGEGGLPVGLLYGPSQRSACVPQGRPASASIAGSAPLRRRDVSLGGHATAEQGRHLWRIDRVVFGCAPVDGLHRAGRPPDKGHAFLRPESSEPVPGAETCNGHHQPLPIRGNGLEQGVGSDWHGAVQQQCSVVLQDADVHGAGMQVAPPVKLVLIGGASHEGSSCLFTWNFPTSASHGGRLRGEASIIITALHLTASSVRSCVVPASSRR